MPQISPDGARIVYTRQQVNKIEDRWDSSLWIMNADGSQHRFLAKGSNPRWSSDGKRILYIADGEPRGPQIFVRWIDTDGPATQVTHATEKVADARWSPDGKSIAFSMFVPEKDNWKISMPAAPQGAKWTGAPRVVESLHYRQDQVGFLEDGHTHLFVVSADGGAPRQLTSGKWSVGAGELRGAVPMDWTPDSKSIVFEADRSAEADLHYQTSQLLVADVATGAIRELVAEARLLEPSGGFARWQDRGLHRLPAIEAHALRGGPLRDPVRRRRDAEDQRRLRPRSDQSALGAGFGGRLLRRRRSRLAQRPVRGHRGRRREAGHHRRPRADHGFRLERPDGGGYRDRSRQSARRGALQPAPARRNDQAHQRQRRPAGRHAPGENGGDRLHVQRQREGAGLGREAARFRRRRRSIR